MITPKNILEDAWCYMKSRVLFTAAELDIFTKLDSCHYTAAELARDGSLDERGATRLLDCLITLDLLQKRTEPLPADGRQRGAVGQTSGDAFCR